MNDPAAWGDLEQEQHPLSLPLSQSHCPLTASTPFCISGGPTQTLTCFAQSSMRAKTPLCIPSTGNRDKPVCSCSQCNTSPLNHLAHGNCALPQSVLAALWAGIVYDTPKCRCARKYCLFLFFPNSFLTPANYGADYFMRSCYNWTQ